jgi:hypothetical protein
MHRLQAAIWLGKQPDDIKVGDTFNVHDLQCRIESITGDDILFKRIAAIETTEPPKSHSYKDISDVYNNFNPTTTEKPAGGYPPFTKSITEPMSPFGTPADVKDHQGEVAGGGEKSFTFPKGELRSPHPPFRRAPTDISPDVRYSAVKPNEPSFFVADPQEVKTYITETLTDRMSAIERAMQTDNFSLLSYLLDDLKNTVEGINYTLKRMIGGDKHYVG